MHNKQRKSEPSNFIVTPLTLFQVVNRVLLAVIYQMAVNLPRTKQADNLEPDKLKGKK